MAVVNLNTASTSFRASAPFTQIGNPITIQSATVAYADVTTDCGANATLDGSGNIVLSSDNVDTVYLANIISKNAVSNSVTSTGAQF